MDRVLAKASCDVSCRATEGGHVQRKMRATVRNASEMNGVNNEEEKRHGRIRGMVEEQEEVIRVAAQGRGRKGGGERGRESPRARRRCCCSCCLLLV